MYHVSESKNDHISVLKQICHAYTNYYTVCPHIALLSIQCNVVLSFNMLTKILKVI